MVKMGLRERGLGGIRTGNRDPEVEGRVLKGQFSWKRGLGERERNTEKGKVVKMAVEKGGVFTPYTP